MNTSLLVLGGVVFHPLYSFGAQYRKKVPIQPKMRHREEAGVKHQGGKTTTIGFCL